MGIKERAIKKQLGIETTSIVTSSGNSAVVKKEVMTFDINNLKIYRDAFTKLVEENIISGTYESNNWNGMGDKYMRNFNFEEFEYNRYIQESLKAFCIIQLYQRRLSVDVVVAYLRYIKNAVDLTKNFDIEYIVKLDDKLEGHTINTAREMLNGIVQYLLFNPGDTAEDYLEMLSSREEWSNQIFNPRIIPPVTSFIIFSKVIENYFSENIGLDKLKFYPIYIWWKVTSVIPIRSSEFLRIRRNCLKNENKYSMKISRRKRKANPLSKKANVAFCDTFDITKEVYDLINDYIEKFKIQDEKYLFPLNAYSRYSKYENSILNRSTHKDRFNYNHLKNLLNQFYDEVVKKEYDVIKSVSEFEEDNQQSIVRLKLGDTRHFAFCSLMIQGFNPLTIASLGGHISLDSQMNYHRHLDSYIDCQVYLLKQLIKKDIVLNELNGNFKSSRELMLIEHGKMQSIRKREGGWCCSSNFPNECTRVKCLRCSKFKLDMNLITDVFRTELNEISKEIEEEVQSVLELVKRYYSADINELESHINDNELMKDVAMLKKVIKQKARILAIEEKIKEI